MRIDPTDRYGRGPANYQMTAEDQEQWSLTLPFTLIDVVVTDAGETAGYAYSHGVEGWGAADGEGDFRVVIIGPDSTLRLNQAVKRTSSQFLHSNPNPVAEGILVNSTSDRAVFRVADPDLNRGNEQWWVHELSTGKEIKRVSPKLLMDDHEHTQSIVDAQVIAGTPLTLLHWWRYQNPDPQHPDKSALGARFTLVDSSAQPVWSLELPRDYVSDNDDQAADQLVNLMQRRGAIIETRRAEFDLFLAHDSVRATFAVSESDGAWQVNRKDSKSFDWAELDMRPQQSAENLQRDNMIPQRAAKIPERQLKLLESILLEGRRQPSPIRGVADFVFDDQGRIAFKSSHPGERDEFVMIDARGKELLRLPLPTGNEQDASLGWIANDRFVLTASKAGVEEKSAGYWIDAETKSITPIKEFDCPPADQICACSDGGFVILATMRYKYTMTSGLYRYDRDGKQLWKITEDFSDHLFSPEDVTVTSDDQIAVLDNIRKTIQLFNLDGDFNGEIDLEQSWQREPNYPVAIRAIKNGFTIHDFDAEPSYVKMTARGEVISGFTPRLPNQQQLDEYLIEVATDGRHWVSDRDAIMRLDSSGVVDRTLGDPPDSDQLGNIAASHVDRRGWIYAVDQRSAKTHVFDTHGNRQFVCLPHPNDCRDSLFKPSLAVTDQGNIYLGVAGAGETGRFLKFSESGTRIGAVSVDEGLEMCRKWYAQPGTTAGLLLGFDAAFLVDGDFQITRKIDRDANNRWLTYLSQACFASDGRFAMLSEDHAGLMVNIYSPNGEPLHSIPVPATVSQFPALAFNHDRIAVAGDGHIAFINVDGTSTAYGIATIDNQGPVQPHISEDATELLLIPESGPVLRNEFPR